MTWRHPVAIPSFVDALAQELIDEAKVTPRKQKAFPTPFRFSDAGGCSRALSYGALGLEPDDGMDPAGLWVTNLGTRIHEWVQEALLRRYPHAQIEVVGNLNDVTSGHCDLVLDHGGVRTLFELKTTGAYAFDKAVGLNRKGYKLTDPEGPRMSAVLQAGLNALAHKCGQVVIGYLAMEAVSVQLAEKTGLRHLDRFMAEWHIEESIWRPMAEAELERLDKILGYLNAGMLPEREAVDDDGSVTTLSPEGSRTPWRCGYCGFRPRCEADGPGVVPVEHRLP